IMPALAVHLHGTTTAYSLLIGANALGGVLAAALAERLASAPRLALVIMGSIAVECLALWACVFVGHVAPALGLQVASGAGMVIVDVLAFTALQRDLPRDLLGRVLGSVDVLLLGTSVISAFAASLLLNQVGIGWAL